MANSIHIEQEQESRSVIEAIAEDTHRPFDDVNKLFVETFDKLDSDARIKDFLILLTSKTVRDELRK